MNQLRDGIQTTEKGEGSRRTPPIRPAFEEPDAGWLERHRPGIVLVLLALAAVGAAVGIAKAPQYVPWLSQPHRVLKVMLGAIIALAVLSRPLVSLALMPLAFTYLVWLPKSPIPLLNGMNLLLVSLLFGWLGQTVGARRQVFERSPLNLPIVIYLLWFLFGWIRSTVLSEGGGARVFQMFGGFWRSASGLVLFFPIYNTVRTWKQIRLLTLLFCIGSALGAIGIYKEAIGFGWRRGVGGGFGQINEAAAYFATTTLFCIGMLSAGYRGFWQRLAVFGSLIGCAAALIIPASRGAYAGFLVGASTQLARAGWIWLVLVAMLVGAFFLWAPDYVKERATRAEEAVTAEEDALGAIDEEGGGRITYWKTSLQVVADHPLLGVGAGKIVEQMEERIGRRKVSHNLYLEVAAEMGIPGVCLLLWIFFAAISAPGPLMAHRGFSRALGLSFQSALVVLMVANIFGNRFFSFSLSGMFSFLCALMLRARRLLEEGVPSEEGAVR